MNGQAQYKIKKCYINAYSQIPVPFGSNLHIPPTNYHLLRRAIQKKAYHLFNKSHTKKKPIISLTRAIQKSLTVNENIFAFYGKKMRRMDH